MKPLSYMDLATYFVIFTYQCQEKAHFCSAIDFIAAKYAIVDNFLEKRLIFF